MLAVEGKTGNDLAWSLAQLFQLRGLVPNDTEVKDVPTSIHEGHWRAARADGDGGAFAHLFMFTNASGVRVRLSTWQSCVLHDLHNFYGATVSLVSLHAMIRCIVKFLRDGNRLHKYRDVAAWISGRGDVEKPPLRGDGAEMARSERERQCSDAPRIPIAPRLLALHRKREGDDNVDRAPSITWSPTAIARYDVCDTSIKTLTRRPDAPGEKYMFSTAEPLAATVAIVDGACTTLDDCNAKLARQDDGLK